MASHWVKFTVIFIIASGLLLAGFFLSWYPHSVIEGLNTKLSQNDLTQPQRDWFQSSLIWWSNQGVFTYESISNFVIASGILVLTYAIVYAFLSTWRESIKAKILLAKRQEVSKVESQGKQKTKAGFPIASGILTIIASCIVMVFSCILIGGGILTVSSSYTAQSISLLGDGLFGIVVFAFALTGGIMTLKRKNFVLAILGLCFMVGKGATFIIVATDLLGASIGLVIITLAVLSLIFTSMSYKEFS